MTIKIPKTPDVTIHVEAKSYKGKQYMDVREYGPNKEKQIVPYKSGLTIPPEMVDDVIAALQKEKALLAKNVVDVEGEQERFFIGKNAEDAMFKKKQVYDTEEEALSKEPPNGFKLYKILVKDGAVIKERALHKRVDDEWQPIKTKSERNEDKVQIAGTKTAAAKAAARTNGGKSAKKVR